MSFFKICAILLLVLAASVLAEENMICAHCNKPIFGEYIYAFGKYYHPQHFICAYCGKVIREGFNVRGEKVYHTSCYNEHVLIKCALCGKILEGKYVTDSWGNAYCPEHVDNAPRCEYCGRFISEKLTGGYVVYKDGRDVCNLCYKSAVMDLSHIGRFLRKIIGSASKRGIDISLDNVDFVMDMRDSLLEEVTDKYKGYSGLTDCTREISGTTHTCNCRVSMLYGLPENWFLQVLAHEMMHVWIAQNTTIEHDELLNEGSANYLAYLVLNDQGDENFNVIKEQMFDNQLAGYSLGLRLVKELVDSAGIESWLEYLKTESKLPGY